MSIPGSLPPEGTPLPILDPTRHPELGEDTLPGSAGGSIVARLDDATVGESLEALADVRRPEAHQDGRISPPWAEINDPDRFIPPLTDGERRLALFLDEVLPRPDWRIYVRPHLDADRPLIAALHPVAGGMFWDVVDWDLSHFTVEEGIWVGQGPVSGRFSSPFRFLNDVRTRLYGVHVPQIGEALNDERRHFGVMRAGLFFSESTTNDALRLASKDPSSSHLEVFGVGALDPGHPGLVVPILERDGDLGDGWFEALDLALTHERRILDPFATIPLSREQRPLAKPGAGYTGIEGVVGSGKTIVLAHRAAAVAEEGRRALILTFNRTLTNYVRGMLGLVPVTYRRDLVTVLHFHELCRRIHDHYREPLPRVGGRDDDGADQAALENSWPASAMRLLEQRGLPELLRFDAVFVDEAQDFSPAWFELIQHLHAPEVVLAYDSAQRLYERDEAMTRGDIARLFGGRTGRMHRLGKSIRLPASSIEIARRFAERWSLPPSPIEAADQEFLPPDAAVSTMDVASPAEAAASSLGVLRTWQAAPDYMARDVAVVVPDKAIGETLVHLLAEQGVSTNHVFAVSHTGALMETPLVGPDEPAWRISQAKKTAFAFGDARLKVSTVHSFKGWEAGRVILMLPFRPASKRTAVLVFVGLTRSRGELLLLGRIGDYGLDQIEGIVARPPHVDPSVVKRFEELAKEGAANRPPLELERPQRLPPSDEEAELWPPGWHEWASGNG